MGTDRGRGGTERQTGLGGDLVAVSKTMPAEAVQEAVAAGVRILGENRVQEAREKIAGHGH